MQIQVDRLESRVLLSANPVYTELTGTDNPFNGIDVGTYSTPKLVDLDGDGDLDLAVAAQDNALRYYKNTGTASSPIFAAQTGAANPFNGLSFGTYCTPAFGDLDGDGVLDLVAGEQSGTFRYFKNTGTASSPVFTAKTGTDNPLNGLDVGNFSTPKLGDLDGDGDLDLVSGDTVGQFKYFRNTGTTSSPVFVAQTGANNPFNGFDVGSAASVPTLGDVDKDGDLDLVSGGDNGTQFYYKNTGTNSSPVFANQTGTANPFNGLDVGTFSAPDLGDLDGDGDLDAVSGAADGTLKFYRAGPGLAASTASLDLGTTPPGTAGSSQTFTVSGIALAGNITITAPTGVEVSKDSGGSWHASLTLTPSGGVVADTSILARISASASAGPVSGNIAVSSTSATTKNVAVTGSVVNSNDAPVVDLNGATGGLDVTTAFTEQTPVLIAPDGTVTDGDSADLTSLTVTLSTRPDGDSVESLSLNTAATTAASGLTVSYTTATGVLSITGTASVATYETILRGILYGNTSNLPTTTNRSVTIVTHDGSDPSATTTATVTVSTVNDAPVAVNGTLAAYHGFTASGTLVVNDVDNNPAEITISIESGPSHGVVVITDVHTGAYTYTATSGYIGSDSFSFKAFDGHEFSNIETVSISVSTFAPPAPQIIDNGDAGYSETGSWKNKSSQGPAGYLGDLRYANPNTTIYGANAYDNGVRVAVPGDAEFATADVDTATFTFTDLAAGYYQIAVNYKSHNNRASNAMFTVSGTGVSDQTVFINQRLAPSSFVSYTPSTSSWQTLVASFGSVSANGTITVTLSSAGANGYVIADAVRIQQIAPLQVASNRAANPVNEVLSYQDLQQATSEAIDRWSATGLTASQLATLNSVQFQIKDLPGADLGVQASNVITIDSNAAGYGWFIDETLRTDLEFSTTDSPTELRATASSSAFGKMDLLTVVMHELGHILSLDHSADGTSVMADELDVGMRRILLPAKTGVSETSADRTVELTLSDAIDQGTTSKPESAVGVNHKRESKRSKPERASKSASGNRRASLNKSKSQKNRVETVVDAGPESTLDLLFAANSLDH